MTAHVDLIRNEWHGDCQVLAARLFPLDHDVKVDGQIAGDWQAALPEVLSDPDTGEKLARVEDPSAFLGQLHRLASNSYFIFSEPHEDHDCPFMRATVVPFEAFEVPDEVAAP